MCSINTKNSSKETFWTRKGKFVSLGLQSCSTLPSTNIQNPKQDMETLEILMVLTGLPPLNLRQHIHDWVVIRLKNFFSILWTALWYVGHILLLPLVYPLEFMKTCIATSSLVMFYAAYKCEGAESLNFLYLGLLYIAYLALDWAFDRIGIVLFFRAGNRTDYVGVQIPLDLSTYNYVGFLMTNVGSLATLLGYENAGCLMVLLGLVTMLHRRSYVRKIIYLIRRQRSHFPHIVLGSIAAA